MENSNHSPLKLLYIGTNEGLISELSEKNEKFELTQFDNGLKAHKYLNSNEIIDAIICELVDVNLKLFDFSANAATLIIESFSDPGLGPNSIIDSAPS